MDELPPGLEVVIGDWIIDTLLEKHEHYLMWGRLLSRTDGESRPRLHTIAGRRVLLPFSSDLATGKTIVRAWVSADEEGLTILVRDDTEGFPGGSLIVAARVPGYDIYAVVIYHDWFGTSARWFGPADAAPGEAP